MFVENFTLLLILQLSLNLDYKYYNKPKRLSNNKYNEYFLI